MLSNYLNLPEYVLWWVMQDNCWYYTVRDSRGTRYILYFWDGKLRHDLEVVDYAY